MIVLIPAYEPGEKLIKVVSEIKNKTDYGILIVNDGSKKAYNSIFKKAQQLGCTVLSHKENKGKGEALKTGFRYILSNNLNQSVVCADCDGQHHIKDIVRVADAIEENQSIMVLGVREFTGKVPLKSRIGNRITAILFQAATKININDTQTGLRGYPYSMLRWLLSVEGRRFEYELEVLLQSESVGVDIKQIPILTIYENNNESTHFHPIRDSIRVYIPLLKFSLSSFASAAIDFILLFVFQNLTSSLFMGVLLSRIVSSVFNYSANKMLVFKANTVSHMQSAPKYFSLVGFNMMLNYMLIAFFINNLSVSSVLAKILTELILFVFSYAMQSRFIFRRKKRLVDQNKDISVYPKLKKVS